MKTRPTSCSASISRSLALRRSVTNQMRPLARSGRASSGRARRPASNCVVSMQTPTLAMMSQTRSTVSCRLMPTQRSKADRSSAPSPSRAGVEHHLDATVLLPAGGIVAAVAGSVGRHWPGLAVALDRRRRRHAAARGEPVPHGRGARLRQLHVIGVGPDRVGVALDARRLAAELVDLGACGGERLLGIGPQARLVEVEQRVGNDAEPLLAAAGAGRAHGLDSLRHLDLAGFLPGPLRLLNLSRHLPGPFGCWISPGTFHVPLGAWI